MSITHLTSVSQLNNILSESTDKLSVIDFHATWCGPCHMIAPVFEALSKQYRNVNFLKCDVDAAKDIARTYGVSAMPTFIFLQGSTKVDQIRGADKAGLEQALRRHSSGSSAGAFSGKGQTLGGSSPTESSTDDFGIAAAFDRLDPQLKVLLFLLAGYLLFWYFS
ncbi:thioredoxin-domain-containing protein [Laetiporus sulphureus 93-53]|uniref:Thioredoxin n=1 Tax=Laetiporus sulphureus 93-53 TaxID=1314785 RepID=A0A165F7F5_9APHY|nr:thioredoxin-domain-containing protein [Laetiporus sulphureus 93-53]KZT08535.1 thioredoxin-domain-containing protein [Laetiporus sulphureus 93-53]